MSWTASVTSGGSWLSITSGLSGMDAGTITSSYDQNTGSQRTGTIRVTASEATGSPIDVTVTQSGPCTYSISPTSEHFSSSGGTDSVSVTAESGCDWTATSNDSWISIISGSSGSGNGTVSYSVSSNSSANSRTGTMTIAGEIFTVTQSGNNMAGVFIADFGSNEVMKVYPDGTECFKVGSFNFLNQGAVSANLSKGTVMVADSNNDRIVEVSENGEVISSAYGFSYPPDVSIKNPPPEGVVLSLPLKGDKNASCPQRGRGLLSPIRIKIAEIICFQLIVLVPLDISHICVSCRHPNRLYQHNNLLTKNDYPNRAFSSTFEIY